MSTILCIEDDEQTAGLLAEALTELSYTVELARDGKEGLAAILSHKPDLVICDIRMPILNGFEVLERLAAAGPALADTPFVFLTALGDRDSELAGRRLGADDYLTKPVDFEMLGAVIQHRLRRRQESNQLKSEYSLTDREREVLSWAGRGKTSSDIATILGLSERTVNFHFDQAMKRLSVTNRTQAVAKAVAQGLISIGA
ncbi:MAG: response regulator transcription factor [Rhodomicrobium sp.]